MIKLSLTFLMLLILGQSAQAQCTTESCVTKLTDGYTFLKTYKMEATGAEVEYSYVFSKGTNYMLLICNQDGTSKDIEVTLYDSQRNKIASNFDKASNKYYAAVAYSCQATGIYYMKYTYKTKPQCCVSVLAFKK